MEIVSYLDFDLLIQRAGTNYRAQVVNSPAGQASTDFGIPFSDLELENFLLRVGRPQRGFRRIDSPEVEAAKVFGQRLFSTIFNSEVRACLRSSLDEANRQGVGLRIRLRLTDVPELADLPWEYLYNPALNRFLTLSVTTPIVRYLDLPERISPLAVTPPLHVLVMISSPSDYPRLNVEQEWTKLHDALSDLEKRGLLTLERLEDATLASLQQRLRRGEYHIFHFIGHGGFDQRLQDGVLILEDEEQRGRPVSGQDLGTVMHDHRPMRLAILNACEGARTSRTDPYAGMAQSLVQQGIPAVIAMQFEITDEAAITFAHEFYGAIADGYPVDAALAEARKSIFAQGNSLEWGTPVLYLRSPDGVLFNIQKEEVSEKKEAEVILVGQEPKEGELKEKASLYEKPSEADEKAEVERLVSSARELQNKGMFDEALETWKKIILLDPKNPEALKGIEQTEGRKKKGIEIKWPKIAAGVVGLILVLIIGLYIRDRVISKKEKVTILSPEIVDFSAEPSMIKKGEFSTLRWNTSNAKEVQISSIGKVSLDGSKRVNPKETTTYVLTARNEEGDTVERDTIVQVSIQNDIRNFKATSVSDTEMQITVDYIYSGDKGTSNIFMSAYALQNDGSQLPDGAHTPAAVGVGDGGATIKLIRKEGGPSKFGALTSTMVKVCMTTSGGGDPFYCVNFPYNKVWPVPSIVSPEIPAKTPAPSKTASARLDPEPTVFRVADVSLKADPSNYAGPCPVTIRFSGGISVASGSCNVSYKFLRSDGVPAPLQTLTFKSQGSKDVSTTWKLGRADLSRIYDGWMSIQIVEPKEIASKRASFKIQCKGRETQDAIQHPERYIKVTDWSFYIAFNGVAVIHHVTIENTSDIAYKNIEVRVRYSSRSGVGVSGEKKVLPITILPRSKKDYLESGFVLGAGSRDLDVQAIEVLGAVPATKEALPDY